VDSNPTGLALHDAGKRLFVTNSGNLVGHICSAYEAGVAVALPQPTPRSARTGGTGPTPVRWRGASYSTPMSASFTGKPNYGTYSALQPSYPIDDVGHRGQGPMAAISAKRSSPRRTGSTRRPSTRRSGSPSAGSAPEYALMGNTAVREKKEEGEK
jgi:hypothetical protein